MSRLVDRLPDPSRPLVSLCVNLGVVVMVRAIAAVFPLTPVERVVLVTAFLAGIVVAVHPSWTRRVSP